LRKLALNLVACWLIVSLCFAGSACGLRGGILVTFDVAGEKYNIFITNKETIKQVYAVQAGESRATIPNGKLIKGAASYNPGWSWYIDPEDVIMTDLAVDLFNGLPSQVEQDVNYWVYWIQRYAPLQAKIAKIVVYQ
jgi:hypothetical protein